ncbi:MAG: hypothetical protein HY918_01940 [Candidatus Doudnabacteria bacterium]|nr:hypothetical protein [Candidatus Doudnabacteria bacterium]
MNNRFFPWQEAMISLAFAALALCLILRWHHGYDFANKVEQPLRQAVFAKNMKDCQKNIDTAVTHLRGYGLKKTDLHFAVNPASPPFQIWFNNLVEIQEATIRYNLSNEPPDDQLFISLIRDRLMIKRKDKFILILPPDHKSYPHTKLYNWWFWISLAALALSLIWKKASG